VPLALPAADTDTPRAGRAALEGGGRVKRAAFTAFSAFVRRSFAVGVVTFADGRLVVRRCPFRTAKEVRRSEWASANDKTPIGERHDANRERPSHESAESGESGALDAAAAFEGGAASPRGVCIRGGERQRH